MFYSFLLLSSLFCGCISLAPNKGFFGFFHSDLTNVKNQPTIKYPSKLSNLKLISFLNEKIDQKRIYNDVATLSSFYNRRHDSKYGVQSEDWLYDAISDIIQSSDGFYETAIARISHSWAQSSLVVSIKNKHVSESKKLLILGSHFDSTNIFFFAQHLPAPGADDDASGVSTLLEIMRNFVNNCELNLTSTIQFHFYSGEEGGLLGSNEVFRTIQAKDDITVVGMLQMDQIGSPVKNNEQIGLLTDMSTNFPLTKFVELLLQKVCDIKYVLTKCGYDCSDHASAYKYGFPSACVLESEFKNINKFVHTPLDTIDRLNFTFLGEFVKLGMSYLVELGTYEFELLED